MGKIFDSLKNRFYYTMESIRNRYPCRLIGVKDSLNSYKRATVRYQAVTKLNVRESKLEELLDDPLLVEKFHPTECVRLGFLAAGEIFFKDTDSLDEAKEKYKKIISEMFKYLEQGEHNDPEQEAP